MSDIGDFRRAEAQAKQLVANEAQLRDRLAHAASDAEPEPGYLEQGEPTRISFERMWEEACGRDKNLIGSVSNDDLEQARRFCPTTYIPLDGARPLDKAIIGYVCNEHTHPVTVFAPKDTAVYITDGSLVPDDQLPEGYNLSDALSGAYSEIKPNILYYPQSFCFHPGAIKHKAPGYSPATLSGEPRPVLTIDTARTTVQDGKGMYRDDDYIDPWPVDHVTGHGHAIADLIGRMTAEPDHAVLWGLRPETGNTYQMISPTGERFRAFDEVMLLANLKMATATHEDAEILNLSLGAPATPAMMMNDPIGIWLNDWIENGVANGQVRSVVAAAGNHQTCVPNWPAAHSAAWATLRSGASKQKLGGTLTHREHIYSVGSEAFAAANPNKVPFSAVNDREDSWIGFQRKGRDIAVKFDDTTVDHAWTGTSFAAPQVAAELSVSAPVPTKKP